MIVEQIAFGILMGAALLFWLYAISYRVWLLIKPLVFGDWTEGWRIVPDRERSDGA